MTGGYFSDDLKPSSERIHQSPFQMRIKEIKQYTYLLTDRPLAVYIGYYGYFKVISDATMTQNSVFLHHF